MKLTEQIDNLCKKHNLSEEVKKDILELCKDSYTKGSYDCHDWYGKAKTKSLGDKIFCRGDNPVDFLENLVK